MSGIAGCFFFNNQNGIKAEPGIIDNMLEEMTAGAAQEVRSYSNETDLCLGISNSHGVLTAKMFENSDYVFCVNGYNFNDLEIEAIATQRSGNTQISKTEILFRLYELKGSEIVNYLNGIYVIIVYNKNEHKLFIYTDRHGYEFLYYYKDETKFIFATEIKPILSRIKKTASIDSGAVCDIFNFSSVFANRTPLSQIKLLPHAAICSASPGGLTVNQYWEYPLELSQFDKDEKMLQKEAQNVLSAAVEGALTGADIAGIMLSGGLDSRLLASIAQSNHSALKAFSFSFKEVNSSEHLLAQQIADKLGLEFEYINGDEDIPLAEQVSRTLLDCDGNWGFYEFIPYIQKISARYPGIALINGFLLDTLFKSGWAFFPTKIAGRMTSDRIANLYTTIPAYVQRIMFTPDFFETVQHRKIEAVEEINANFSYDQPAEVSLRFYCLNRGRRSHNSILKAYRKYVNILLPGADYRLTDFSFKLPYEIRSSPKFYLDLICQWFPGIAQVPWDKTGKPLTMGLIKKNKIIENYLFKAKYYTQRLSHGKVDFLNKNGSFNRILRHNKEMMNQVKTILLDPGSLSRGYYKKENIELLIKNQMIGKDLSTAFKALISVEMLHRALID